MKNKSTWLLLAGLGGYLLLRRQGLRGGASEDEVYSSLPGDELIPHPMVETTHAVTIQAPPSAVWPWLVQAGYRGSGRAGWYSDSWVDVLVEGGILPLLVPPDELTKHPGARSAWEILPQFQHIEVGDVIPDGPPGSAYFLVKAVEKERLMALYSDSHTKYLVPTSLQRTRWATSGDFSWVFVLRPSGELGTRLILRTRANLYPKLVRELWKPAYYLAEAIFPMLILRGIKRRAESIA